MASATAAIAGNPEKGKRTTLRVFSAAFVMNLLVGLLKWLDRESPVPWLLAFLLDAALLYALWTGRRWLFGALLSLGGMGGLVLLLRLPDWQWLALALMAITVPWLWVQCFPVHVDAFVEQRRKMRQGTLPRIE